MYKLIHADGTEIDVGLCGSYDGGPLYIQVFNKTFVECSQIFMDQTKTTTMTYEYSVGRDVYAGYTELSALALEDGCIRVTMRKPVAE